MTGKSPSTIFYEFLSQIVTSAADDSPIKGVQVLDSENQRIEKDKGIIVSNSEFSLGPTSVDDDEFYDALLVIGFFVQISADDYTERRQGRDECFALAFETNRKIFEDEELKDADGKKRVCDLQVLDAVDGSRNVSGKHYAIINLPIILNPRSRRDFNLGEAR